MLPGSSLWRLCFLLPKQLGAKHLVVSFPGRHWKNHCPSLPLNARGSRLKAQRPERLKDSEAGGRDTSAWGWSTHSRPQPSHLTGVTGRTESTHTSRNRTWINSIINQATNPWLQLCDVLEDRAGRGPGARTRRVPGDWASGINSKQQSCSSRCVLRVIRATASSRLGLGRVAGTCRYPRCL